MSDQETQLKATSVAVDEAAKASPKSGSVVHAFDCTHNPCRCESDAMPWYLHLLLAALCLLAVVTIVAAFVRG